MTSPPAPPYEDVNSNAYQQSLLRHTYSSGDLELEFASHAKTPGSTPIFFTGSVVAGFVSLRANRADMPKSIIVKIEGCGADHTGGYHAHNPFWKLSTSVFPPSLSQESASFEGSPAPVHGMHVFPFSIQIPKTFTPLSQRGSAQQYDLPPTFTDHLAYSLHYTLFVEVKRGFMKLDESIQVRFLHFPIMRPGRPMSALRCEAYSRSLPLPLPSDDPDGYVSSATPIKSRLSSGAIVPMWCELYLAQPTAYLPGSPLHFFLKFSTFSKTSHNGAFLSQAIEILSAPMSVRVFVQRQVTMSGAGHDHVSETIATATTWKLKNMDRETDDVAERLMQGEVALPADLLPGFTFPTLRLDYRVNLIIDAPGFSALPPVPHGAAIISMPVTILNTSLIGEPLPIYYAPHA